MNDKEKQMYDALFKIERNTDILEYVHDSITEGTGEVRGELFSGAILEIMLNIRESTNKIHEVIKECEYMTRVTKETVMCKYIVNHELTSEQFHKICEVLGVSISDLNGIID